MIEFRSIDQWPDGWRESGRYGRSSPFRASYDDTLELLRRELDALDAKRCIVAVDTPERDFRRDGMLRSDARVGYRGVIVTIDTEKLGTLVYSCDAFESWSSRIPSWQANLRAVALGLEALRKVERYGIAERGQQYAGFGALPPATPMDAAPPLSTDEALRLLDLDRLAPDETVARATVRAAWKAKAAPHHPDVGGDAGTFRRLTEARDLLLRVIAER